MTPVYRPPLGVGSVRSVPYAGKRWAVGNEPCFSLCLLFAGALGFLGFDYLLG